jgi:hypothetical protein
MLPSVFAIRARLGNLIEVAAFFLLAGAAESTTRCKSTPSAASQAIATVSLSL